MHLQNICKFWPKLSQTVRYRHTSHPCWNFSLSEMQSLCFFIQYVKLNRILVKLPTHWTPLIIIQNIKWFYFSYITSKTGWLFYPINGTINWWNTEIVTNSTINSYFIMCKWIFKKFKMLLMTVLSFNSKIHSSHMGFNKNIFFLLFCVSRRVDV